MIGIVFKKEMLSHLLSQRFAACTVLAVVLIIANGVLTSQTYVHKKAGYLTQRAIEETKLHEITYYSVLGWDWLMSPNGGFKPKAAPRALRAPRPLAVFAQGAERQAGQAVKVMLFNVPYQAEEVSPFQSSNPYLAIFAFFDMVYIFQLVLGLLAVLIASEAISGEKEDGTLRLMLTTNASRAQVLAGKILAGLTTLAIPTALGFILLTILLLGTENIEVGVGEWVRVGLLFALSLLYLLVFYLIGLADLVCDPPLGNQLDLTRCSRGRCWRLCCPTASQPCSTSRPTWVKSMPKPITKPHKCGRSSIRRSRTSLGRTARPSTFPQTWSSMVHTKGRGTVIYDDGTETYSKRDGQMPRIYLSNVADSPSLAKFQDIVRSGERLRLQYAQRAYNEQAPLIEGFPRRIERWNDQLQRLLPAGAYTQAAGLLAGTSRREYYDFIDQVRAYRGAGSSPFSKTATHLVPASGSTTTKAGALTCATCRGFTSTPGRPPRA